MSGFVAFFFAVLGSTMIGCWGDSFWLGVGIYFCIAAVGSWNKR